jgi:hypothetical protein
MYFKGTLGDESRENLAEGGTPDRKAFREGSFGGEPFAWLEFRLN